MNGVVSLAEVIDKSMTECYTRYHRFVEGLMFVDEKLCDVYAFRLDSDTIDNVLEFVREMNERVFPAVRNTLDTITSHAEAIKAAMTRFQLPGSKFLKMTESTPATSMTSTCLIFFS